MTAGRLLEDAAADVGLIRGPEVRAIGQVKRLENEVDPHPFAELQGLADTRVELEEPVSAQVAEGDLEAVAGAEPFTEVSA